jgi:hypothetical protein
MAYAIKFHEGMLVPQFKFTEKVSKFIQKWLCHDIQFHPTLKIP